MSGDLDVLMVILTVVVVNFNSTAFYFFFNLFFLRVIIRIRKEKTRIRWVLIFIRQIFEVGVVFQGKEQNSEPVLMTRGVFEVFAGQPNTHLPVFDVLGEGWSISAL